MTRHSNSAASHSSTHGLHFSGDHGGALGACGYGNLYSQGYGVNTAALSTALFNSGLSCGACFEIKCANDPSGATPAAPPSSSPPPTSAHLTTLFPATMAAGVTLLVPTSTLPCPCFSRSPSTAPELSPLLSVGECPSRFLFPLCLSDARLTSLSGYPAERVEESDSPSTVFRYFNLVLVTNVAGAGDIVRVSIKGSKTGWMSMSRNWGQNWQSNAVLVGQSLSFRVTGSDRRTSTSWNVAPANWQFGQTFSGRNFRI
ncbi:Expansin-A4 [Vitis vinifera]|uniref:Expansin n=1 Tax=Vitis vinifera TaxID=29760 RepID=A0A438HSJ0_VITVI|nr:Expansin-A4 [Vitis vinifera]